MQRRPTNTPNAMIYIVLTIIKNEVKHIKHFRYQADAIEDLNREVASLRERFDEEDEYASNEDELEDLEENESATLYFDNGNASIVFDWLDIY